MIINQFHVDLIIQARNKAIEMLTEMESDSWKWFWDQDGIMAYRKPQEGKSKHAIKGHFETPVLVNTAYELFSDPSYVK